MNFETYFLILIHLVDQLMTFDVLHYNLHLVLVVSLRLLLQQRFVIEQIIRLDFYLREARSFIPLFVSMGVI